MANDVKIKMHVRFEVEPDTGVQIPALLGEVAVKPAVERPEHALSSILKHFAGSFLPGSDVEEVAGPKLIEAMQKAREALMV